MAVSCQREPDPVLTVSGEASFNSTASSQEFTITTNRNWEVSASESWVAISPKSGTVQSTKDETKVTVRVSCMTNDSFDPREATLTVKHSDGGLSKTITLKQGQKNAIVIDQTQFLVDARPQQVVIPLQTNVTLSAQIPSGSTWIKSAETRALRDGSVVLDLEGNDKTEERSATIAIKGDGVQMSVNVKQLPGHEAITTLCPGIYPTEGEPVLYRKGIDQLVFGQNSSDRYFRLMNHSIPSVTEITGIPDNVGLGDSFKVNLKTTNARGAQPGEEVPVLAILVEEDVLCLLREDGKAVYLIKTKEP